MTEVAKLLLRLPKSLKKAAEEASRQEGTSTNQFITLAVAEKLAALNTAEYFAQKRSNADFESFDRIMQRDTGTPPREGDELP
ncbi:MAG: toxin-antitoxin system HicB family antitoxin [Alphaproteobacteria bacterium]|nr:toxin-antitoxin system HicB family antitoxin [Alphaproteobacteria bacterium]